MTPILRRNILGKPVLTISFLLLLMSLPGSSAHLLNLLRPTVKAATTFTVNAIGDLADSSPGDGVCNAAGGTCTLRAAIQEANALAGDDVIGFSPSLNNSTITLNTALPDLSSNLNIAGPNAALLKVQRNTAEGTPTFRIFTITSEKTVSISGLTVSNGRAVGTSFPDDTGGGILNNNGTVTLNNLVVSGNSASFAAGGIDNTDGTMTINNSSISNNVATASGGGINNNGAFGTEVLTINNSTISNNSSGNQAGGLFNVGVAALNNTTVSSNSAFIGGGINNFGPLTLTSTTITGNSGGGIGNSGTSVTFSNTIIAGNSASFPSPDCVGFGYVSQDYNLIGNPGEAQIVGTTTHNITNVNALLGPLAANGGPTLTHALLVGSPAIDAANSAVALDQRGQPRPVDDPTVANAAGGNASDIGAYEAHMLEANSTADADDGLCRPLGTGNGCTLREAINAANSEAGAERIVFAPALTSGGSATITLSSALPDLSSDLTISGSGAALLTVRRSSAAETPNFRIFTINSGTTVNISGLTITNGRAPDGVNNGSSGDVGGGIRNIGSLTLTNSTISGNQSGNGGNSDFGGQGGDGGGIYNDSVATMTIANCTISGNQTGNGAPGINGNGGFGGHGGGIYNVGNLTMSNSTIGGNRTGNAGSSITGNGGTGGAGGGVYNFGTMLLTNNIISGNQTGNGANGSNFAGEGGPGGGVANGNDLTMIGNAISSNLTGNGGNGTSGFSRGGGGGLGAGVSNGGTLTLTNSTISGNQIGSAGSGTFGGTGGPGGGVFNGRILILANSTISSNQSGSGGNGTNSGSHGGLGGGIYNEFIIAITNATVSGNQTGNGGGGVGGGSGGGIYNCCGSTNNNIKNTIIANNTVASGGSGPDLFGTFTSQDYNLFEDITGATLNGTTAHNITGQDPRLGSLANNGGPTQTLALLAGSPALDAGDDCVTLAVHCGDPNIPQLTTDQRGVGFARNVDGPDTDTADEVDIGAFEAQISVADIADQTINEDAPLSLPFNVGGAANITGMTASSSNPLVPNFPDNISISGSGSTRTLTINPAANLFGTSTITVAVNGNNGQSMNDTFVLTVNPLNDAPSFTRGLNQTVTENDGAQTVNNWANNISAGPADESGQSLTFVVTNNSNAALFTVAPAISPTGTLTYTPATGMSGTASITIALQDNGGTANGGSNTSATQSFNINVQEGGTLAFSLATYNVTENGGSAVITLTRSGGSAGTATVQFATSNGTATADDYTSVSQTVTFNGADVSKTVNVAITDDLFDEPAETVNLALSNAGGTGELGSQTTALLTIGDNDPAGGYLHFFTPAHGTTEGTGSTPVTVERLGTTTQAVTVVYATSEGHAALPCSITDSLASPRCDFTSARGTLRFAPGETSKVIEVLISQDNYVEGAETLFLTLSTITGGAALTAPAVTPLTIADDVTEPAANPIDSADAFVTQHYHDFLNREPDPAGLAFWTNQITECQQPGATCSTEVRRINASAAFFLSIEFQETGYLAYRFYKSAYGNVSGAPVPLNLSEFLPDTQQLGKDVVIGQPGAEQQLEANKVAYALDFVTRSRFTTAYPTSLTPAQFVDMLFVNAEVTPSTTDRDAAINEFGGAGNTADTAARARALRRVAENSILRTQESNKAFVLMQYFGYLRRNPNDPPEAGLNFDGYNFWLGKLNEFNGNFVNAEMVKAFIISGEYRHRFGQ